MARFFFDSNRCIGCHACEVACKQWHGTPPGEPGGRVVTCREEGTFPHVTCIYTSRATRRCDLCRSVDGHPHCARTCPTGALRYE